MNDDAREKLREMIAAYGPTVCNTPRSCELFVQQCCGQYKDEKLALIQALQTGTVAKVLALKPEQWDSESPQLAVSLAEQSGMSEPDAQWAVEAWAIALKKHPAAASQAPTPKLVVEESQQVAERGVNYGNRVLVVTMAGALGGLVGGAFWAVVLVLRQRGSHGRA